MEERGARWQCTSVHNKHSKIRMPSHRWTLFYLLLCSMSLTFCNAFAPLNCLQLKTAILTCLKLSPKGRCNNHPHGPMGTWDVSRVTDMSRMFSGFKEFDADISNWDVSRVKDMRGMFLHAQSFTGDISKWDVSRVEDMSGMFAGCRSFKRKLCGLPWVNSKADQSAMFAGSLGSIARDFCSGSCARTFVPCHRRRRNSVATDFAPKSGEQLKSAVSTVLENSPSGSNYCSSVGTKTGDFDNELPFQKKIEFDFGPPISATVPPGQCVLGEDFAPIPLTSRINISKDTVVLTFGLPNKRASLGLSTCACIVASNGQGTARAYTPISTNAMLGQFQLMVKVYDDTLGGGIMSRHMNSLAIGDTVDFKHIPFNVKVQYPFGVQHVGMLAGGTGLTPMIQALHAILGNEKDSTKATLVWSNKQEKDISVQTMDNWAKQFPDRFNMVHTLTREPEDSSWSGRRGRIDKKLIEETMPKPSESCKIFVCGPADMYDPLIGLLKEMDYSDDQIVRI